MRQAMSTPSFGPTSDKLMKKALTSDRWSILGAGSIGALWAKSIEPRASFIFKDQATLAQFQQQACRLQNFRVEDDKGINYIRVHGECPSTITEPIDNLLICTKAQQTLPAIAQIEANINSETMIVLMQNGLGVYEMLSERFPNNNILSATTTHGAFKKDQFHVFHAGQGETWIGSLSSNTSNTLLQNAADSLMSEKFPIVIDPTITLRLWKKLAINCAINPLTALYQCRNGELLENRESRHQLYKLCAEIDSVLQSLEIISKNDSVLTEVEAVARKTANNFSSMYQDINHKRLSEIDYINGYLCAQAKKLDIDTPENLKVLQAIKNIEAQY